LDALAAQDNQKAISSCRKWQAAVNKLYVYTSRDCVWWGTWSEQHFQSTWRNFHDSCCQQVLALTYDKLATRGPRLCDLDLLAVLACIFAASSVPWTSMPSWPESSCHLGHDLYEALLTL